MRIKLNKTDDMIEIEFAGKRSEIGGEFTKDGKASFTWKPDPDDARGANVIVDTQGYVRKIEITGLALLAKDFKSS